MNYTFAHEAALKRFQSDSLEEMAELSGYALDGQDLVVELLGQKFKVSYPSGCFKPLSDEIGELPLPAQILTLHYLTSKGRKAETGKFISYKELPGGEIYNEPFFNRSVRPFVSAFGHTPEKMLKMAELIGGQKANLGDVSVTIRVFPRVPVTLVLWKGDEEFPPAGTILFDESVAQILHTEDCAVMAGYVVSRLKMLADMN